MRLGHLGGGIRNVFSCPQRSGGNKDDKRWWRFPSPTKLLWLSTSCALHHELLMVHLFSSGWWKEGAVLTQVQQNTKNLGFLPLLCLHDFSGLAIYSVAAPALLQQHTRGRVEKHSILTSLFSHWRKILRLYTKSSRI